MASLLDGEGVSGEGSRGCLITVDVLELEGVGLDVVQQVGTDRD